MTTLSPTTAPQVRMPQARPARASSQLTGTDTFTPSGAGCAPETRDRIRQLLLDGLKLDNAADPAMLKAVGGAALGAGGAATLGALWGLGEAAIGAVAAGTGGAILVVGVAGALQLLNEAHKLYAHAEDLNRQSGCYSKEEWQRLWERPKVG